MMEKLLVDIYFELNINKLDFIDYIMLPKGGNGSSKIALNNIMLQNGEYLLEIEVKYDNKTLVRIHNLDGYLIFQAYEDTKYSDAEIYSNLLCSPSPIPDSKTKFTRHTDEGTIYFVDNSYDDKKSVLQYLSNPYMQYKGGTELTSETGINLFSLDNGISPVCLNNGLVKCDFHLRSGYISIYRYDEETGMWYKCNTFKLDDNPQLILESYDDDSCTITFGKTI